MSDRGEGCWLLQGESMVDCERDPPGHTSVWIGGQGSCARGVYCLQVSYDFVNMPRGDKGGWRASRRTWTLRGGLDVNMGERINKRSCHTTLACIYMHIMEESGSLGYGLGPGPYNTVHAMPIIKLGRPGQPARYYCDLVWDHSLDRAHGGISEMESNKRMGGNSPYLPLWVSPWVASDMARRQSHMA